MQQQDEQQKQDQQQKPKPKKKKGFGKKPAFSLDTDAVNNEYTGGPEQTLHEQEAAIKQLTLNEIEGQRIGYVWVNNEIENNLLPDESNEERGNHGLAAINANAALDNNVKHILYIDRTHPGATFIPEEALEKLEPNVEIKTVNTLFHELNSFLEQNQQRIDEYNQHATKKFDSKVIINTLRKIYHTEMMHGKPAFAGNAVKLAILINDGMYSDIGVNYSEIPTQNSCRPPKGSAFIKQTPPNIHHIVNAVNTFYKTYTYNGMQNVTEFVQGAMNELEKTTNGRRAQDQAFSEAISAISDLSTIDAYTFTNNNKLSHTHNPTRDEAIKQKNAKQLDDTKKQLALQRNKPLQEDYKKDMKAGNIDVNKGVMKEQPDLENPMKPQQLQKQQLQQEQPDLHNQVNKEQNWAHEINQTMEEMQYTFNNQTQQEPHDLENPMTLQQLQKQSQIQVKNIGEIYQEFTKQSTKQYNIPEKEQQNVNQSAQQPGNSGHNKGMSK